MGEDPLGEGPQAGPAGLCQGKTALQKARRVWGREKGERASLSLAVQA